MGSETQGFTAKGEKRDALHERAEPGHVRGAVHVQQDQQPRRRRHDAPAQLRRLTGPRDGDSSAALLPQATVAADQCERGQKRGINCDGA